MKGSVGILKRSVGILKGSVGILKGSVGILKGSVGILIHWYYEHWYFELWYFEPLPVRTFCKEALRLHLRFGTKSWEDPVSDQVSNVFDLRIF